MAVRVRMMLQTRGSRQHHRHRLVLCARSWCNPMVVVLQMDLSGRMTFNEPRLVCSWLFVSCKATYVRLVWDVFHSDMFPQQSEGKELTKEEKQRLRKEKKQQKKSKEKKDEKASQESEKEKKPAGSASPASQPPTQPATQKGCQGNVSLQLWSVTVINRHPDPSVCRRLPQLLQRCLLRFLCLPPKLLPRQTSRPRVKQSWKLREELGRRLTGPPNRARKERWDSRPPPANRKHRPVSCSQVLW